MGTGFFVRGGRSAARATGCVTHETREPGLARPFRDPAGWVLARSGRRGPTAPGRDAGPAGRRVGHADGWLGPSRRTRRAHPRAGGPPGGGLPPGAGGPGGDEHQSPRFAAARRPDAPEDPPSPRADVEPERGVQHRLQPRAPPRRGHPDAGGADLQPHLSRIDQLRGPRARSHRPARPEPPGPEPRRHPGPRPPPGPIPESRGARPDLLPRGRRGPSAVGGPDEAEETPAAGRHDQRRGPAEPPRAGRTSSGWTLAGRGSRMPGWPTFAG